jgi:hypothetical protein
MAAAIERRKPMSFWATENGIISGTSPGVLSPAGTTTRAQAASSIRMIISNSRRPQAVKTAVARSDREEGIVPPAVDYGLTPLGESLMEHIRGFKAWTDAYYPFVEQARREYDRKHGDRSEK